MNKWDVAATLGALVILNSCGDPCSYRSEYGTCVQEITGSLEQGSITRTQALMIEEFGRGVAAMGEHRLTVELHDGGLRWDGKRRDGLYWRDRVLAQVDTSLGPCPGNVALAHEILHHLLWEWYDTGDNKHIRPEWDRLVPVRKRVRASFPGECPMYEPPPDCSHGR